MVKYSSVRLVSVARVGLVTLADRRVLEDWLDVVALDSVMLETSWWDTNPIYSKLSVAIKGISVDDFHSRLPPRTDIDLSRLNVDYLYHVKGMVLGVIRGLLESYTLRCSSGKEVLNLDFSILGREAISITAGTFLYD